MTIPGSAPLLLNPEVEVLSRRNGDIQIGWDPESAVVIGTRSSADRRAVQQLVRSLNGTMPKRTIVRQAVAAGMAELRAMRIIDDLGTSGHLIIRSSGTTGSVRVHGSGPLAEAITAELAATSLRVSRSRDMRTLSDVRRWSADLVVLADALVWEPSFTRELVRSGIAHLVIRTRDGRGIIGPMVIPGVTSCLMCADLTRSAYDPEWPWLAAQLIGRSGTATPSTRSATTAFTVSEILAQVSPSATRRPVTHNATIEVDVSRAETTRRNWRIQSGCECQKVVHRPGSAAEAVS